MRNNEHDELRDLGTSQRLDRVMRWFSMTEEERQSLKGNLAPPLMDKAVEINEANLENVGDEFGYLKLKETGTKPKDIPPKPTKHQTTKPFFSNQGLSVPGTSQTISNDHQMTNVRGQLAIEQTILKKEDE